VHLTRVDPEAGTRVDGRGPDGSPDPSAQDHRHTPDAGDATAPVRPPAAPERAPRRRGRFTPTVSGVVGASVVLWGLAVGLLRLRDNSFLTHVATGRLILAHGVPASDPYTFTAHGRPWVVESWLASVLYAVVQRADSAHGLQLLHAALAAALAGVTWVLTRPARQLGGRIVAAAAVLAVGSGYWSPRPLLIALLLFGLLMVMVETGAGSPWMVVPVVWVWVDVHASWPFAFLYVVVRLVGRRADGRGPGRLPQLLGAAALGVALAALNPQGLRLLEYPLTVLTHHQAFAHVAEWQSPSFADAVNVVFLAEVLLAVIILVARRGTVEDVLLTTVFSAAALLASRNVPVAALVVAPVLARGLSGLGTLDGMRRGTVPALAMGTLAVLGTVLVARAMQHPEYDLSAYPVQEVSWMQRHGLAPGPVATPDYVGNYLEFRYGTRASAFVDDRVDVFPPAVERGYGVLLDGGQSWQSVLDRYGVRTVLWPRSEPLATLVRRAPDWSVRLIDRNWVVAVHVPTAARRPRGPGG